MRECDEEIWHSYERHLLAENIADTTVEGYKRAVGLLSDALPDDTDLYDAGPDDITAWISDGKKAGWSDSTQATYARRVRTFYTWALAREWVDKHPMRSIRRIRETEKKMPMPPAQDVVALLESIRADGKRPGYDKRKGWERRFRSRRDLAMIGILCEPGTPRATELATSLLAELDMRADRLGILRKGRRERTVRFGDITATALGLYLRARKEHKHASRPELFLSCSSMSDGRLTRHGVREIIADRCDAADIARINPHAFRNLTAHEWLKAGGSETDAMELFGWKSYAMVRRYAAAAAADRALDHARQMSLGDRLMSGKS